MVINRMTAIKVIVVKVIEASKETFKQILVCYDEVSS